MGSPMKMTNPMKPRAHYEDEQARRMEEEIVYLDNHSGGSHPSLS